MTRSKRFFGLQIFGQWRRTAALIWSAAPQWTTIWAILLVISGVLPGATVYLTKLVIDGLVAIKNQQGESSAISETLVFAALLAATLILTELLQSASEWTRTAQAEEVTNYIKDRIHRQAASLDIAFYETPEYHDLMEQARGESSSKPLALLESAGALLQSSITLLAMATILIGYGWWLPLVLVIGTLPTLYNSLYFNRAYHAWWKGTATDRRWQSYFDAMLTHPNSAGEIRLFNLSEHFRRQYQNLRKRLRDEKLAHLRRQSLGKLAASFVALLTVAGAMSWAVYRVIYGAATLGDLVIFYQVFTRGQQLTKSVLGGVSQTLNNSLYLANLFAFFDLKSKIASPAAPLEALVRLQEGIRFNNVSFVYPGAERAAIKDFNLFIPANKIVALVGVNGAGKSTLIKLISRFYDATEGRIEFDGVNIQRFDLAELRRTISVLFQFPMQYQATAGGNIALGDVSRTFDRVDIETAARNAGAANFIEKLPEKYETLLGKWFINGAELSGGEWQRVALARAYFRRAPIVILDEPTSFMDSWSEVDWFDRFSEMVAGRTSLIITHRFTIAMRADIIHVIDNGKIVESGTHSELLAENGFYAKSWKAQMQIVSKHESNDASASYENAYQAEEAPLF